ncbi:MAG TPA: hypothetical protein VE093_31805 [Polyangiaceae bacterium]|jgi:hypothetical protein|nr:hypothetical protein [Polyangiaceae bacterium]
MTKIRPYVKLAAALAGAAILWGCGGNVVLEPDDNGQGGGASVSSATSSSQASTGSGAMCSDTTCIGLGTESCSCQRTCGFAKLESTCALNDDKVLVCVCSYDDSFSGTCFEKTPNVCDIDKGCCAKYFQGI